MYLTYLISCINFKAAVIFATLINFGYTSKSPLTAVNLVDVVQYHVDRFTQSFDKTLQENLILLSNIADHIFINSTEILFNNSCAQSLNKLRKDITTSQFYALRSIYFFIVILINKTLLFIVYMLFYCYYNLIDFIYISL